MTNRYFITSLPWDRLSGQQILTLVRQHWGVENGCHWTADVVLSEDSRPWCTKGRALRMLCWIRLMAYNLLRLLRHRHLRSENNRQMPWEELRRGIFLALTSARNWDAGQNAEAALSRA